MLLDDGVLVLKEGEWVAAVDLTTVQVPPAISALLAARLDRLSNDERAVLEAASVAGEVFERSAVRELVPDGVADNVDAHLGTLLRKDLIRPSTSDIGGEESFRFRHILLRDAAYDAVPKGDRAELHEAFAAHLEASLGDRASEFEEFTGYHLEQAHRFRKELGVHDERTRSLARAAFERLGVAGRRAFDRGDAAAATNLLGRASELLDPDDLDRLRIAWRLGQALTDSGHLAGAADLLEATIARAAGDEAIAGYAEAVLWSTRMLGDPEGDVDAWEAAADRLIALFERIGDDQGAALAWLQKTYALWFRWRMEDSGSAAQHAAEHAYAAGDHLVEREARSHLLATLALGPRPLSEAQAAMREALDQARRTGDRRTEQSALKGVAMQAAYRGDFEEARRSIAESRAIVRELGLMIEYWASAQNSGRIEILAGDLDEAARQLLEGCEQLLALGETAMLSTAAAILAYVEVRRGDDEAAERWVAVAERTASADDRASQIGIETARGLLKRGRGDLDGERHLRTALELADGTDATLWRTEIRLDIARALPGDRPDEIAALAREALSLAEGKQVPRQIVAARRILAELGQDA